MPSPLQLTSTRRKLVYLGLILGLFIVNTFFWRGVTASGQPLAWTVAAQAQDLELTEETQGETDLLGSTVRLGLTGSRGLAVTILWHAAIDKQRRNEWNELEFIVRSLTKLQPRFLTPWLFQSWNLSYNVSVENDRVADKYFYIARGIELLAQGERLNRDNPDMRYWLGFYYQNKFGISDERNTLRSLFQLSDMDPAERDPAKFRTTPGGPVNMEEFEKFCRKNPQLVRRLRENVLKPNTPADLVDFLVDNRKLPTRFVDSAVDGGLFLGKPGDLKPVDQQFPVLPTRKPQRFVSGVDEKSSSEVLGDWFCNFQAARAWFSYGQDPLPDPVPGPADKNERLRAQKGRRLPRQPAEVVFRQAPARAQSNVAERLQQEGWFDESGWVVDANRSGQSRWFPDKPGLVIGEGRLNGTADVWTAAFNMWRDDGIITGIYLEPTQEAALIEQAREFRERYQVRETDNASAFSLESMPTASLAQSLDAHRKLVYRLQNVTMTNFPAHYYRADAERDRDAVQARKLVYEADQYRKAAEPERAVEIYDKGFNLWKSVLTKEQYREFRNGEAIQGENYEAQYRYLEVLSELRGGQLRPALVVRDLLTEGAAGLGGGATPGQAYVGFLYGLVHDTKLLPLPLPGPFDGNAADGRPWIDPDVVSTVRQRLGLQVAPPPSSTPAAPTGEPPR